MTLTLRPALRRRTPPRAADSGTRPDRSLPPDRMVPAAADQPAALPAPPLANRRNPRWIALGVVAICLGGLLSYVLYAKVAAQTSAVAMLTTVHRGEIVKRTDLTTVTVSGTVAVTTVPAASLEGLVGQHALYDLVAGALVPSGAIGETAVPAPGRAAVGLRLVQGRAPIGLLIPGSPIRLIKLPAVDQGGGAEKADERAGQEYFGLVVSQADAADGTAILLNVDVPTADAATITLLGAQDRIAVLRDPEK